MKTYDFDEHDNYILETMPVPYVIYQYIKNKVIPKVVSDGFCDLFEVTREEAFGIGSTDLFKMIHKGDRSRLAEAVRSFSGNDEPFDIVCRAQKQKTGAWFIVHIFGEHIYTEDSARLGFVWYIDEGSYNGEYSLIRGKSTADGEANPSADTNQGETNTGELKMELNDIFHQWVHKVEIIKDNYFDKLTGLPNLTYFLLLAEDFKYNVTAEDGNPVMLFFDLNGMKAYNEKYGFTEGDRLLKEFANILKKYFSNERCGRYGADHFVVFTEDDGNTEETLEKIFEELKELNKGKTLPVRVGICQNSFQEVDAKVACDRAKIACDHEKDNYTSHYNYFNQKLHDTWSGKMYVLDNLDKAIEEGWIQSYYQPIVRSVTGLICSEEALCRWIDPEKGLMAPDEFISILEESGLLYMLDLCMVDNIIRDIKMKQSKGLRAVPVSVNLSWSDFQACDMVSEISRRTEAAGISNDLINIEITERVLGKDPDYMRRQIDRFHELGFNVWMDDFGSGYSSLDIMQNYDFDLIKFNMQFMREYETSQKSKVVLTELTQLAIKLGIDTLTEGVETIEQVRFLREIGCDKIQGYYYSQPKPVDVVMDRYQRGVAIGLENTDEMDYFDIICKASLRDPSANNIGQSRVYNYFSTVPIGIFEVRKDGYYAIRYNKTCGDFLESRKGSKLEQITKNSTFFKIDLDKAFTDMLDTCSVKDDWDYFENIADGGNVLKAFAKRLAVNPVTGAAAVMVIAMSVVREQNAEI